MRSIQKNKTKKKTQTGLERVNGKKNCQNFHFWVNYQFKSQKDTHTQSFCDALAAHKHTHHFNLTAT